MIKVLRQNEIKNNNLQYLLEKIQKIVFIILKKHLTFFHNQNKSSLGLIDQDFVLKRDLSKVHYKNKNNKIILEIVIVSLKNFLKIFKKIINHNDIKIKKLKVMNKAKKQGKDVDSYLKINHQMMTSLISLKLNL